MIVWPGLEIPATEKKITKKEKHGYSTIAQLAQTVNTHGIVVIVVVGGAGYAGRGVLMMVIAAAVLGKLVHVLPWAGGATVRSTDRPGRGRVSAAAHAVQLTAPTTAAASPTASSTTTATAAPYGAARYIAEQTDRADRTTVLGGN